MMFHVEQNQQCPICNGSEWTPQLACKDYTVSGEMFTIAACNNCGFWATVNAPNESEIGKYYQSDAYISHSDSRKGLMNQLYHIARKRALKWKVKLVGLTKETRVLDYGCGTGYFPQEVLKSGASVVGVEPDQQARAQCDSKGIEVYAPEDRDQITGSFDVISLWHVLEHLHQLHQDAGWLTQRLNNNGKLFIAVPNRMSFDAQYYREHWAAYDVPRHLWHFTEQDIQALFEQHGMKLVKSVPMRMDAYYVSMLSEQYRGKNKLNGVLIGRKSNSKGKLSGFSSMVYVLEKTK